MMERDAAVTLDDLRRLSKVIWNLVEYREKNRNLNKCINDVYKRCVVY